MQTPMSLPFASIDYLYASFHVHHFITVNILNAPFHLLLYVPYDPRSRTDTLSRRLSFVDVLHVYKETLLR